MPNILKATIGLPLQLVSGYKCTSEIRLAFNSGEVSAVSISWESAKSTWRKEVESGEMSITLQGNTKSHPELAKVPVSINLAKTAGKPFRASPRLDQHVQNMREE